jgi:H+/Cl- antiporter ClcA
MMDFFAAFGRVLARLFEAVDEVEDRPQARKALTGCILGLLLICLALSLAALTGW